MFNTNFIMKNKREDKQEEYIQYLYSVIDILKQKLQDSKSQCKEYSGKLRHSEKICDEKEKFILFRESQLIELEDTINELKQQISSSNSNNKMSAPGSRRESRSRSRSRSRAELVSLDTMDNTRLVERINASANELFRYAMGIERMQNMGVGQHLKDVIATASDIIGEHCNAIGERIDEIDRLRTENHNLNQSLQGVIAELRNIEIDDQEIEALYQETENNFNEFKNGISNILQEYWQLDEDDDIVYELERNLDWNRRELAQMNNMINYINDQLNNCRQERNEIRRHYEAEQILTRVLSRRIILLKTTKRQLQIELLNAPVIAPAPPPPQPINQIWLLLQ